MASARQFIVPKMPAEFISVPNAIEVAPGYVIYKFNNNKEDPGCIMRVGATPLKNIGDWMGYIAWDMDPKEKDEQQIQAEKIMIREILALYPLSMTDKIILGELNVDLEKYKDYRTEIMGGSQASSV